MRTKTLLLLAGYAGILLTLTAAAQTPRPKARREGFRDARRLVGTLAITDLQRAEALEAARAAEPIVRAARARAARILVDARGPRTGEGAGAVDREALRARLREVREQAAAELEPLARRVLSTLTSEQRARLAERAKSRGRELDEKRLLRRISLAISRPMAVPLLEARLGR